jgi:hypothetical protein
VSSLHERMRTPEEVQAKTNPVTSISGGILALKIERAVTVTIGRVGDTYPEGQCQALEHCVHGHWFSDGDQYVTFGGGHMHVDCLERLAHISSRLDFLLMLAAHVSRAPSNHNAGTIRQVINGLVRALGAVQRESEQAAGDAYARGAVEASAAIAKAGASVGLPIDVASAIADAEDEGQ